MAGKYLTFRLRDETYGIPVARVREIVPMPAVTPVPQSPAYIKGVFNLRSKVLPVVDLRARLGQAAAPYADRACLVVVDVDVASTRVPMGVAVDGVSEVVSIADEEIEALPQCDGGAYAGFVGVTASSTGMMLLLDVDRLLGTAPRD
jgi:purine-binding chemotaxis protein CheW